MDKEQILKMMEAQGYEECTSIEAELRINYSEAEKQLSFKKKQKFPIVFKNDEYQIRVYEKGDLQIEILQATTVRDIFHIQNSLPLLEQAINESRRIRGTKNV
jgi:hypothetical protein